MSSIHSPIEKLMSNEYLEKARLEFIMKRRKAMHQKRNKQDDSDDEDSYAEDIEYFKL